MIANHKIQPTDCCICLNVMNSNTKKTLHCHHSFCKDCIDKWETKNDNCPCCRTKIQKNDDKYRDPLLDPFSDIYNLPRELINFDFM